MVRWKVCVGLAFVLSQDAMGAPTDLVSCSVLLGGIPPYAACVQRATIELQPKKDGAAFLTPTELLEFLVQIIQPTLRSVTVFAKYRREQVPTASAVQSAFLKGVSFDWEEGPRKQFGKERIAFQTRYDRNRGDWEYFGIFQDPIKPNAAVQGLQFHLRTQDGMVKFYTATFVWSEVSSAMPSVDYGDLTDVPKLLLEKSRWYEAKNAQLEVLTPRVEAKSSAAKPKKTESEKPSARIARVKGLEDEVRAMNGELLVLERRSRELLTDLGEEDVRLGAQTVRTAAVIDAAERALRGVRVRDLDVGPLRESLRMKIAKLRHLWGVGEELRSTLLENHSRPIDSIGEDSHKAPTAQQNPQQKISVGTRLSVEYEQGLFERLNTLNAQSVRLHDFISLQERLIWPDDQVKGKSVSSLIADLLDATSDVTLEMNGLMWTPETDGTLPGSAQLNAVLGADGPVLENMSLIDLVERAERVYANRIVFAPRAKSAAEKSDVRDVGMVSKMLRAMATVLYPLLFEDNRSASREIALAFGSQTRFEVTFTESRATRRNARLMVDRQLEFEGHQYKILAHVKASGKGRESLRIYFDVDREGRRIVVGHVGTHLPTARDRRPL